MWVRAPDGSTSADTSTRPDARPRNPQARAPFPYIAPTFYDRSIGNGSYHALQVEVNKRYSNGLAYQVAYTYSKSIDEGSSGWFGVEGQSLTDPYNVKEVAPIRV